MRLRSRVRVVGHPTPFRVRSSSPWFLGRSALIVDWLIRRVTRFTVCVVYGVYDPCAPLRVMTFQHA